jgi:hypothetical protein
MDGFDYYVTADISKRWTTNSVWAVSPLAARQPSGQGITASGAALVTKTFGANYTAGCIGWAWQNTAGGNNAARTFMTVLDGASEQISVRTNSSGVLVVNRGATLLATGTTVLSINVWYYIELKFSIHASAGTVLMQLNGATETLTYVTGTSTTQNTKATANVQWNGFQFNQPGSGITYNIDDVYVLDTSTGTNTTFLGPVRVVASYPAANGTHADWTPNGGSNMGSVSEQYEDGDASFNASATANQIDTFELQDLPVASGSVLAVSPHYVIRQDAGAARTFAPVLRIGGSDYVGSTQGLSSSYQNLGQIYDLQPVGGTPAWDVSTVNAMESGYKLIS